MLSNTGNAENRLLALLPGPEAERWRPHLELVNMPLGQVIYEPGAELGFGGMRRGGHQSRRPDRNQPSYPQHTPIPHRAPARSARLGAS